MTRTVILLLCIAVCYALPRPVEITAQTVTRIGQGAEEFEELFTGLQRELKESHFMVKRTFGGRERTIFVPWIRDHIHVLKALKYFEDDLSSYLEFFLETQTPEGIFFDYYYPLESHISHRMNLFDQRYWRIFSQDSIQMHRLPIEADLEYLLVEGVYHVWQATGDTAFVRKWLPALEKGMYYAMSDPLRWSKKYQLVKRGYTLDTWDFMHLHPNRAEYSRRGGDVQEGIFDIDENTPMGIMHGDNSGMYAASLQLSDMYAALGNTAMAGVWAHQAAIFRLRTNAVAWNGRFYAHFVEDDPQPEYYTMDQRNTLGLSNPYSINRGLPTETMARSIIRTYLDLKETTSDSSFAEWFGIYPAVKPHFSDYEPGSYMNGGVNTIVAGELAKAALQHGYEAYGVDILRRVLDLMRKHDGDLPVAYRPDGSVDEGIPDNWGQAAVMSALLEGLAGVVDQTALFDTVEVSPRWLAAGKDTVDVTVSYGPNDRYVTYSYAHDPSTRTISLDLSGTANHYRISLLLPDATNQIGTRVDGKSALANVERNLTSSYAVIETIPAGSHRIEVRY